MIKIIPPKIFALPDNFVPKFLPINKPIIQIIKVVNAIIKAQIKAIAKPYSLIVQPTESASIEVAIPWSKRIPIPKVKDFSSSEFSFSPFPSKIILIPIILNKINAIHGTILVKLLKQLHKVWTKNHPIIGISAWKNANTPAIKIILDFFIFGSFNPFAKETEKASIAKPTPSKKLFTKNTTFQLIKTPKDKNKTRIQLKAIFGLKFKIKEQHV